MASLLRKQGFRFARGALGWFHLKYILYILFFLHLLSFNFFIIFLFEFPSHFCVGPGRSSLLLRGLFPLNLIISRKKNKLVIKFKLFVSCEYLFIHFTFHFYSDAAFITKMKNYEDKLEIDRANAASVKKSVDQIDWAYWEKTIKTPVSFVSC